MKVLSVFFVCLLHSCFISVSGDLLEFGAACAAKTLKCQLRRNLDLDVSHIIVYFYDFQNSVSKSFHVKTADQEILSLNLNKDNQIYMFVGGFRSNIKKNSMERIKTAFSTIENSYLIIIDHSAYTNDKDGYKKSYERSVKYVHYIGKQLAQMLAGLHQGGIAASNIHCIGHSLGSQILGHVGESFIKATGQKIARITALDPAGPCFADKSDTEHIRSGVADYVEVYHCNAGIFGSARSLADVDFYVNNGRSQPYCVSQSFKPSDCLNTSKCNHKICVTMWTSSVMHRNWYKAYKCSDYKSFKHGKCYENDNTTAGFWNPGTATGVYYFSTDGDNFI